MCCNSYADCSSAYCSIILSSKKAEQRLFFTLDQQINLNAQVSADSHGQDPTSPTTVCPDARLWPGHCDGRIKQRTLNVNIEFCGLIGVVL